MPPLAEEDDNADDAGVGGDGAVGGGGGVVGGADNPATPPRSAPSSCAPSPSMREPFLRDSSTIRDSASFCSTLSGVCVPSPPNGAIRGRAGRASALDECESQGSGRVVDAGPGEGAGDPLRDPPAVTFSTAVLEVSTSDGDEEDTCSVDYALSLVAISDDSSSSSSSSDDTLSIKSALSSPLLSDDCSTTADGGGGGCMAFFASCVLPVGSPDAERANGDAPAEAPLPAKGAGATASDYHAVAQWLAGMFHAAAVARPLLGERRAQIMESAPIAHRLHGPHHRDSPSSGDPTAASAACHLSAADLSKLCIALVPYELVLEPVTDADVVLSAAEGGLQRGPLVRLSKLPPVRPGPTDPWRYDMPAHQPRPSDGSRLGTSDFNALPNEAAPWEAPTARRLRSPSQSPPPASAVPALSRRPRRLLRTHTMPSRSPTPSRLGPDRGPLHKVVAATRRQAERAAERAAFPIRGPPSGGAPLGGGPSAAPPTTYAKRILRNGDDAQEFDLFYRRVLLTANEVGELVSQTVKIRVRVAASVVSDADPGDPLAGTLRVLDVDTSVEGQLTVVEKQSWSPSRHRVPSRVLGYYIHKLSVRAAVVPPPGNTVVMKDVSGGGDAGVSVINHSTVATTGFTTGGSVGVGGDAGPLPNITVLAERETSRTSEVSAERTMPVSEWSAAIVQREMGGMAGVGCAADRPDSTYVEWTWSLGCWSTGLPYEPASIFRKDTPVWSVLPTTLGVPAQVDGLNALSAQMVLYAQDDAPWSPPSAQDDSTESAMAAAAASLGGAVQTGPDTWAADPADLYRPVGCPANTLEPLLGPGLALAPPLLRLSPPARRHRPPPLSLHVGPCRRRRCRKVAFAVELAPSLALHRQEFRMLHPEHVESERWPPPALPELGVQRFLLRVRVSGGEGKGVGR
ncbi:hypothetical protein BU14_0027s0024 [Porphyra umbilicalis]|uniref:Uncharacterized protein n=1 Tax=Porphyra umbilicalis TaxID=2786 RepID=A0A1X6PJW0_PORUM|nr:hypothetical protein BU14_0027s0024 [Porphyra umbilicalis]|eukprot:OSX80998.1 hypothetical protein BU14_0027s0024 [Porphyra umbilicalis]